MNRHIGINRMKNEFLESCRSGMALFVWKPLLRYGIIRHNMSAIQIGDVGMKKNIAILTMTAVAICTIPVYAESDEPMTFSSEDYEYTVDENGYATLTKYLGTDTDILVPDSIAGHIITGLRDSLFYVQQTEIQEIQLSRDIKDLGAYVFLSDTLQNITVDPENEYFTSVDGVLYIKDETEIAAYPIGREAEEYTIQDGVTAVGPYAFYAGRNLKKVDIPDTVTDIEKFAFIMCENMNSVDLPEGLKTIGENGFYSCNLSEIQLPDSLTQIGETAFNGNPITEITIPAGVTEIGDSPFMGTDLEKINVADENERYYQEDGVLFDREENALVCYPCKKTGPEYQIPEGVSCINTRAFTGNKELEKIVIPDSVTEIKDAGLSSCSNLKEANLPESITTLGRDIFSFDSELTSLYLPASLSSCDKEFLGGTKFTNIEIAPENTAMKEENHTIFTADGKTLIRHYDTSSVEYTVPDGVEEITNTGFESCKTLQSITLPDSVKIFGEYTFSVAMGLPKELVIYLSDNPEAKAYLDEKGITWKHVGENTGNSESDSVSVEYHDSVPNDVTGNWRLAIVDTSHFVTDYALNYYNMFCKDASEIHGIINWQNNTTTSINKAGNLLMLTVHQYVPGEENDAKLLYSGAVLSEYEIDMEIKAVTQIK